MNLTWFRELVRDDRVLGVLETRRSAGAFHTTAANLVAGVERSLDLGESAASAWLTETPSGVLEHLGLSVRLERAEGHAAGVVRHAELDADRGTIYVNCDSVERLASAAARWIGTVAEKEDIFGILAMHEAYHYLERRPSITGRRTTQRAGAGLPPRSSELAAHAFAKTVTRFPFLPSGLDWLMLMDEGRCTPKRLRAHMEEVLGLLEAAELLNA